MYKFVNTVEEIQTSEIVLKQLRKLENYDATVEVKRCEENGRTCFACTIKSGKTIIKATSHRPEVSAGQACDGFVREVRQEKNKRRDKRIDTKRKAEAKDRDRVLQEEVDTL